LGGGAGLVKRHVHKALLSQVVDFAGLSFFHHSNARPQVGLVVSEQVQIGMVLNAQFFYASEVDGAGELVGAANGVALTQNQLWEVGTVLAGKA
jgi:hypothetical protein